MPFLPIAERELRVAARRPGTYRIRWILVLLTLAISSWWFQSMVAHQPVSQQGIMLFSRLLLCLGKFLRERVVHNRISFHRFRLRLQAAMRRMPVIMPLWNFESIHSRSRGVIEEP